MYLGRKQYETLKSAQGFIIGAEHNYHGRRTRCICGGRLEAASFAGGSGTEDDPYLIEDAAQLWLLSSLVNEGNEDYNAAFYELTADIELNGSEDNQWTPIGTENSFRGHFDGNGHRITGLYINGNEDNVGLFGKASKSVIMNVSVSGSVKGKANVGGIVGANFTGKVIRCRNDADVTGTYQVGGIAGLNDVHNGGGDTADVTECVNTGVVSASGYKLGGIVGENTTYKGASRVIRCVNTGQVAAGSSSCEYIGGVVGYNCADSYGVVRVEDCYNTADVARVGVTWLEYGKYVGGVVGRNRAEGSSYVFSSVYQRAEAVVQNCYSVGKVEGMDYVCGIIGSTSFNKGVVKGCSVKGCRFLKTDTLNSELAALYRSGGTGSADVDTETGPLSAEEFGKWNGFKDWDREVWTMGTGLDPRISEVTARPVLIGVDEPDMSVPVTDVTLDMEELTLLSGGTALFIAEVLPEDATDRTVSWKSSDTSVVTVDENGMLTAIAPGTAEITASAGGKSAVCTVTVEAARMDGLSYSGGKASVRVISSAPADIIFAAYKDGQYMGGAVLGLEAMTQTEPSFDVPEGADTVKVFVLGGGYSPLTAHEEIIIE